MGPDSNTGMRARHWAAYLAAAAVLLFALAATAAGGRESALRTYEVVSWEGPTSSGSFTQPPIVWRGRAELATSRSARARDVGPSTVRVFYAYPTDVPGRFSSVADAIVSDIAAIDDWWRTQDPSHAVHWDLLALPNRPIDFGRLDLGVVPLAHDSAYYTGDTGFDRVLSEVAPYTDATEKALVFLDGYVIDKRVCGVSTQAARNGGEYGVSVVSLRSGCRVDLGAGEGTAQIAAHELAHNLGAVSSSAPNRCDPSLGGHVCDSSKDLMFPYASEQVGLKTAILDVGRDDYYGHTGKWWDIEDSAWLTSVPVEFKPVIGSPTVTPKKASAGKRIAFAFSITRGDTGAPLLSTAMTCDPSIAGKRLRHADFLQGASARLSLVIPKVAKGKVLSVKVTVSFGGQAAARTATFRIH